MEELIERLRLIGLTSEEAETYLLLLVHGPSKASEHAAIAKIHRNVAYKRLEQLSAAGFAQVVLNEPREYQAIPVDRLYERALTTLKARESGLLHAFEKIRDDLASLAAQKPHVLARPSYRSIHGRQRALETRLDLIGIAKKQVRVAVPAEQPIEFAFELGAEKIVAGALARGVQVDLLVPAPLAINSLAKIPNGVRVRLRKDATPTCIVDAQEAMIPMHIEGRHGRNGADVWIRTDAAVAIQNQARLFELMWRGAKPLRAALGLVEEDAPYGI